MAMSRDGLSWNGKWFKRSYSSETGITEWSGRSEFINDMPNLNMTTGSLCITIDTHKGYFWDNELKCWWDKKTGKVPQIWD